MNLLEQVEELKGFRDFLILDENGKIEFHHSKIKGVSDRILAGYLASTYSIAERTSLSFIGSADELSFDAESGSVLIMKGHNKYFFLVLDGTPSMGIARLKLRGIVDNYE